MNAWALLYDEMYGPDDAINELEWVRQNGGFEYTPEPTGSVEITAVGFVWPKQKGLRGAEKRRCRKTKNSNAKRNKKAEKLDK